MDWLLDDLLRCRRLRLLLRGELLVEGRLRRRRPRRLLECSSGGGGGGGGGGRSK